MGVVDIIILVILGLAVFKGFRNGLIAEVLGLASIFIAGYMAYYLSAKVATWLSWDFDFKEELAFVLIFIVVVVAVVAVAKILSNLFEAVGLGLLNGIGGLVVSVAKYIIIVCIALSLFNSLNNKMKLVDKKYIRESALMTPLTKITNHLFPFFEDAVKEADNIKKEYFEE